MNNATIQNKVWLWMLAAALATLVSIPAAQAYDTQSNREARVRVDVTPIELAAGKPAKFTVRMNTHSVELDQDISKISTLTDDKGRELKPTGWEGDPPGGHHTKGELSFPPVAADAASVKLVIRNVSRVAERNFQWKLEK